MINFSIAPTEENIIQVMQTDPLKRNRDVFRFVDLISAIDESCSIALNGEWGSGKTFFIKQVKAILDSINPYSSMEKSIGESLQPLFPQSNKWNTSYSTVYYDAWANDNDVDPIISLVYAFSCQTSFEPSRNRKALDIAVAIANALSGRDFTTLLEKLRGTDNFESQKESQNVVSLVNSFIDALIEEHGNRLIIFIDELDRCKPDYAVRMLERIKHYFADNRITFVFSVSLSQLQNTIKCYYGSEFDAARYLDKFFDLRATIPEIEHDSFIRSKFSFIKNSYIYDEICIYTVKHFNFSIRETERYMRLIKIAIKNAHDRPEADYSEEKALSFCICYIVPIAIGLSMVNMKLYEDFLQGKNQEIIKMLLGIKEYLRKDYLFEHDADQSELEKLLEEIYAALFIHKNSSSDYKIGKMKFTKDVRQKSLQMLSLISPYSDYSWSENQN